MARFDEGPSIGRQFLAAVTLLAVLWVGILLAEWAGSASGSLVVTALVASVVPVSMSFIPPLFFGLNYADSETLGREQPRTNFDRALLILKWVLIATVAIFIISEFVQKAEREGLNEADSASIGLIVGSFVFALILRLRTRGLSERQLTQ